VHVYNFLREDNIIVVLTELVGDHALDY